ISWQPTCGGTPVPTPTSTPTSNATSTPTATSGTPSATSTATAGAPSATRTPAPTFTPTATPAACTVEFTDVPEGHTFYPFVRCLACRGIVQGYADGTFRPDNHVTRGQVSKIVSLSAGFAEVVPPTQQSFEDVPHGTTFWEYVERISTRGIIVGYPCSGAGEPCVPPENRPYFRPNAGATRGQLIKIVEESVGFSDVIPETQYTFADVEPGHTFWIYVERLVLNRPTAIQGYPCGGPGEPCDSENRPYLRPNNPVTRGQTSKVVSNTFFPECSPP
ncbi:MAG TPA: S-layer homology domain-containing protein, partial [Chloroflexia bacterium]|nr:S-layer homology domain-containing protein [Chloroflexia bacterium]